jgi:3-deoxy-D-manno-octulosonic-acid transferase
LKFIIAPHNIKRNQIEQFKNSITKAVLSQKSRESLADFDVFIIDTIGILTKIYSYADIAFVGGGLGILAFITY